MYPVQVVSAEVWAEQEFGSVELGEQRRTKRAVHMAAKMVRQPSASLPMQMGARKDVKAVYRLCDEPEVTHEAVVKQHVAQTPEVLGLMHQEPFLRQPAPKGETRAQRQKRPRESDSWLRAVQAIGSPPANRQWVRVGDRYSDMHPFLQACRDEQCHFVIRAAQDRCVQGEEAEHQHLFGWARGLSSQREQDLELPAKAGQKARTARV